MRRGGARSGVIAVALCAIAAAACARPARERAYGTIQVDIESSPTSTDPRFATDAISSRINELVFDSLVRMSRAGQFAGDLAERIERPDPVTIVFHLKHGVRFSDGRELTARDVKFTYDSILAPGSMSAKRAGMLELASVAAPDDFTVTMTTRLPYAPALEIAMQGIVPDGTPLPARSAAPAPPGSGPFTMLSYQRDESVLLARNPYRPAPAAAAREVLFKVVPDPTVRALELAEGICNLSENNIEATVLPWLGDHKSLEISNTPGTTYKYLAFNFRDPRLSDLRVRRAIAYSIDRTAIVNSMLRGTARIATGMLAPEDWAYDGNVARYGYDLAAARRLLDDAGYPAGAGGMRRLRFEYKTTPDGARLAEVLQAMLKRVGITLDVRTLEWATFYGDIQRGDFELTSLQWVGIEDPNYYYMVFDSAMAPPRGSTNRGYYSNPDMDALVEAGQRTLDPDARKQIYAQVQQLAAVDLPYVSLWWVNTVAVLDRGFSGFDPYPNGSLRSLATITIAAPGAAEAAE
ncbi:MAG TPA: ABC transporter substrate-binding protein [Candidatus Binataceae bacterium]|nr:ABC transporter substrate-binding protein [Candidatus Binataceae bacterium]